MKSALVPSCPYPLCCIAGVLCPEWQPSGAHWDLCLPKELQEWESTGTKPEAVLGGTEDSLKHWGFFSLLPCTCALCCDPFTSSMQDSGILSSCCSFTFHTVLSPKPLLFEVTLAFVGSRQQNQVGSLRAQLVQGISNDLQGTDSISVQMQLWLPEPPKTSQLEGRKNKT